MTDFDLNVPFAGLSVLVTGNLPTLSRHAATEHVAALGGKPVASVSGSTGLVVIGDGAGVSKMVKIRRHDLPVLDGAAFEELVTDPSNHPAVLAAAAGGQLGVPCSQWETGRGEPDRDDEDLDPDAGVPFADRHLVGQASGPPRNGGPGVEYRMWCHNCGEKWTGAKGPLSIYDPCPNDPRRGQTA